MSSPDNIGFGNALFMTTNNTLLLFLSLGHNSSLWGLILLLELITHLLHRHPLNTFMLVDVLNQPVYCQLELHLEDFVVYLSCISRACGRPETSG